MDYVQRSRYMTERFPEGENACSGTTLPAVFSSPFAFSACDMNKYCDLERSMHKKTARVSRWETPETRDKKTLRAAAALPFEAPWIVAACFEITCRYFSFPFWQNDPRQNLLLQQPWYSQKRIYRGLGNIAESSHIVVFLPGWNIPESSSLLYVPPFIRSAPFRPAKKIE